MPLSFASFIGPILIGKSFDKLGRRKTTLLFSKKK
jgi:hypothetical protein